MPFISCFNIDLVRFVDSNDSPRMDTINEILEESEEDILIVYTMTMVACNCSNLFNLNKLEEGGQ